MKYIVYKYAVAFFLIACLCGCNDFLEESSQDEVRPGTLADLQELMMGEVYPIGQSFLFYMDLMTDDVNSTFNSDDPNALEIYKWLEGPYTWSKEMYEKMEQAGVSTADIDTYGHFYRCIKGCNIVLEMVDKVKGEPEEKANLRGQALAMRAWYYFMLVNCYAKPFNATGVNIETEPGVVLLLSSVVKDEYPARASMAKVYKQVESDLLGALPLIAQYGQKNSKFRVTEPFIYGLLSRMYLYVENWGEAEKYATSALQLNSRLLNLGGMDYPGDYDNFPAKNVYSLNSEEAIWLGYATGNEYDYYVRSLFPLPFSVSDDLKRLYEYDAYSWDNRMDLRYRNFYKWDCDWVNNWEYEIAIGLKNSTMNVSGAVKGMRVAEIYLNRAESYIQQFLKNGNQTLRTKALADLNFLRRHRYDTRSVAYVPVDITNGDELLQFCRDERRRELSFEDHRWFDLRRYGMPEIKHLFQMQAGQVPKEYTLRKGDLRYTFPIPQSALKKNPNLDQNL